MKNGLFAPKTDVMDIDLLSKMVKELILDNDRVVLPGLGAFVAEIVPSTFSDKGYTINPPYRRLYFRSKPSEGDELAELYAKGNRIDKAVAGRIISDFVAELKINLHSRKTVVFPGLGRLRATKENNVFFVADEDLDIYPAGFGLEPISLKTHQETQEEVTAAVADLKSMLIEPEPQPEIIEPQPVEPEIVPEPTPEPETVEPQPEIAAVEPDASPRHSGLDPESSEPVAEPEVIPTVEVLPEVENVPEVVQDAKEEIPDQVRNDVNNQVRNDVQKIFLIILIVILALAVLFFAALAIIGRTAPEWIDRFLYTQEELRILNHIL